MSEEDQEDPYPQLKEKHIKQIDKFFNNFDKEYHKLCKNLKKDGIPTTIINCYIQTKNEQQNKKQQTPIPYIT